MGSFLFATLSLIALQIPHSTVALASTTEWGADPLFGNTGERQTPLASPIQTDTGRLDMVMSDNDQTFLISSNGLEAFSQGGFKNTTLEAAAATALTPPFPVYGLPDEVELQSTGKLIVANADVLYRLNGNGTLDTSFGNAGRVIEPGNVLPGFTHTQLKVDKQDRLIVARRSTANGFAFMRFSSNGQLDATFGIGGTLLVPPSIEASTGQALDQLIRGIAPDGSMLVSFSTPSTVFRITPTGAVDLSFGVGGSINVAVSVLPFPAPGLWPVFPKADGTFVVVGYSRSPRLAILRVVTFSADGTSTVRTNRTGFFTPTIATERNGFITVSDTGGASLFFNRLTSAGTPLHGWRHPTPAAEQAGPCEVLDSTLTVTMCARRDPATNSLRVSRYTGPQPGPNGEINYVGIDHLSSTSVRLRWTEDITDEAGFLVYRVQNGVQTSLPQCAAPNTTSCVDSGLLPGNYYQYYVYGWNSRGTTYPRSYMFTRTPTDQPEPPTVLAATAVGPNSVRVQWKDNSSNETDFRIYRYLSNGTYSLDGIAAANTTSLVVSNAGLSTAGTTVFVVSASNPAGESNAPGYIFSVRRTTVSTPGPTAPTYGPASATSNSATITWIDNASNEAGYLVYRVEGSNQTLVNCPISSPNLTTCTDTGLVPGRHYQYFVYSWNNLGVGDPGTAIVVRPGSVLRAPVITSVHAESPTNSLQQSSGGSWAGTRLRWSDQSADETAFRVYEYTPATGYTQITFGAGDLAPNTTELSVNYVYNDPAAPGAIYVLSVVRGEEEVFSPHPTWIIKALE